MGVYLCWRARSWLPVCPLPFLPRLRETGRAHQQAIAGRDDIQILTELARLDVSTQDHASSRLMTAEECGPFWHQRPDLLMVVAIGTPDAWNDLSHNRLDTESLPALSKAKILDAS